MAHESFESDAIAAKMNDLFVNVKVDREERPDLDLDSTSSRCRSSVATAAGRSRCSSPPSRSRSSRAVLPAARQTWDARLQVFDAIADAWKTKRDEIVEQADDHERDRQGAVVELQSESSPRRTCSSARRARRPSGSTTSTVASATVRSSRTRWRSTSRPAGVEPTGHGRDGGPQRALSAMRCGGIYDHLGGGFHRYSTDEKWLVPHFEKMLYDNALLARLYVDAARAYNERASSRSRTTCSSGSRAR